MLFFSRWAHNDILVNLSRAHMVSFFVAQVPDIIDNAYVIVEFENGSRGMLDLCMFAEGSKNEQEISVVGDIGKVNPSSISIYTAFAYFILVTQSNQSTCIKQIVAATEPCFIAARES